MRLQLELGSSFRFKKMQVRISFYLSEVAISCFSLLGVCQALSESQYSLLVKRTDYGHPMKA